MDLPPGFWAAVAASVALIGVLGGGAKWLNVRRQEEERDRIAREAHDLAKKALEADNVPRVSVELHNAAEFPGYGVLREGVNYALKPPSPWVKPTALLVATVKNEGKILVATSQAGIRLERTGEVMPLPQSETDLTRQELFFPHPLPPRESFEIRIQPVLIKRMLSVLKARPDDELTFWIAERIGTRYFSQRQQSSDYLEDKEPMEIALSFEPPALVVEIGEEECFPEGIFPEGLAESPPSEHDKN